MINLIQIEIIIIVVNIALISFQNATVNVNDKMVISIVSYY